MRAEVLTVCCYNLAWEQGEPALLWRSVINIKIIWKKKQAITEEEWDSLPLKPVKAACGVIRIIVHNNIDDHDWSCCRIFVLILQNLIFPFVRPSSSSSPFCPFQNPEIVVIMCSTPLYHQRVRVFPSCLARTDCVRSILSVSGKHELHECAGSSIKVLCVSGESALCRIEALLEIHFLLCFKVKVYLSPELRNRSS